MEPYETNVETIYETDDGYKVQAIQDTDPMDPRTWSDHLGTMYCSHRRYALGDVQVTGETDLLERLLCCYEDELGTNPWKKVQKEYIALPLYLYDHSGITISTGGFTSPWDSGQVGYITVPKEKIRQEWGVKRISAKLRSKIIDILVEEVNEYDSYLRGDEWGYVTVDPSGEDIDSVWGFIGRDDDEYIHEAKAVIEAHRKGEITI